MEKGWFQYTTESNSSQKGAEDAKQVQKNNLTQMRSFEREVYQRPGVLAPDVKDIRDSSNRLMSSFAQSCDYSDQDSSLKYVQDSLIR